MSKQPEAPFLNEDQHTDADHEVSKSQLKRDSHALTDLGKKLCALNPQQLAKVPLNETLRDAIELAHRLTSKRGALKRHYQFIGKQLRSLDAQPILDAVAQFEEANSHSTQAFQKIERWRDRILNEGDTALQDYCAAYTSADRQKLRQICRNFQQTQDESKKTRFARALFKELRVHVTAP
jgi:ribosome-associated protein